MAGDDGGDEGRYPYELPPETFRMIVDKTANPFSIIGTDGTIKFASQSIVHLIGWKAEDLVGRNFADLLADEEQLANAIEAISEIESVDHDGAGVPMVFDVLRPDGTTCWIEVGAMPLLDVPGVEGIALRSRGWNSQHHFDRFVDALLADAALEDVLSTLASAVAASTDAAGVVVHYGFDGAAFSGAAGAGVPPDFLALDHGPWIDAAADGGRHHLDAAERNDGIALAALGAGLRGLWVSAVPAAGGLPPAVLTIVRAQPEPPLVGHRHAVERSLRYVRLALVRNAEHQRLRHLAGHDSLTGVANRAAFRDRLALALSIGERDLAVAFCDLDGFKSVNDTYGHRAGDAVLVDVARRLRSGLRAGDELARIGGDEFTVLLRNVPDAASAAHVADRLLAAITDPFVIDGNEVSLGLSVGIALSEPGASADALLAEADEALYRVKRQGGRGSAVTD